MSKWEVVKTAGPKYIPTVLMGVSTLACIFGANTLSKRQQASLISAYALLDETYKKYRRKVVELYDFLGLEPTDYGNTVGWAVEDEFYWLDFNNHKVTLDDGLECYIIETPWGPSPDFLEYYY